MDRDLEKQLDHKKSINQTDRRLVAIGAIRKTDTYLLQRYKPGLLTRLLRRK